MKRFKIEVKNKDSKITNAASFETEQEVNDWIDLQLAKSKPWGFYLPERIKREDDCTAEEIAEALSSEEIIDRVADIYTNYFVEIVNEGAEDEYELWKRDSDCTQEEIDNALDSNEVVIEEESHVEYTLPLTCTYEVIDLGDAPKWEEIRAERDKKIEEMVWVFQRHEREAYLQLDTTLSETVIANCYQYVQDLADIPQLQFDPYSIIWPTKPI